MLYLENGIAITVTVTIIIIINFALALIIQWIILITHHPKIIFATNILIIFRRALLNTKDSSVLLRYLIEFYISMSISHQCKVQLTVLI